MKITIEKLMDVLKSSSNKVVVLITDGEDGKGYRIEKRDENFFNIADYDGQLSIIGATFNQLPGFLSVLGMNKTVLLIEWSNGLRM